MYSSMLDPYEPPRPRRIYDAPQAVSRPHWLLARLFPGLKRAGVSGPAGSGPGAAPEQSHDVGQRRERAYGERRHRAFRNEQVVALPAQLPARKDVADARDELAPGVDDVGLGCRPAVEANERRRLRFFVVADGDPERRVAPEGDDCLDDQCLTYHHSSDVSG